MAIFHCSCCLAGRFLKPPSVASQANDVHIHSPPTSVGKEENFYTEKYRGGGVVGRGRYMKGIVYLCGIYICVYVYSIYSINVYIYI